MPGSLLDSAGLPEPAKSRRIAALVLPDLPCELVTAELEVKNPKRRPPLGVVLVDERGRGELPAATRLDAVNAQAHRLGIRAGQTLGEASSVTAHWTVHELARTELMAALGRVCEVALGFGTPVSLTVPELGSHADYVPDTVWLDITGSAHLFGGEAGLLAELESAVRALGHMVRSAVSSGPLLAQALARWSAGRRSSEKKALEALPVAALPLARERVGWLSRLGIFTLGDLVRLPRPAAAARLGDHASEILDLCTGIDPAPLVPYEPPRVLVEELGFDDPVQGLEPLLFALRRLTSRLSARLAGRGEAAGELLLRLEHDRAVVRLRELPAWAELRFELAEPLGHEDKLFRVLKARLERHQLLAPTVRLVLEVPTIARAPERQLDLGQAYAGLPGRAVDAMPVLLGELMADLGPECVGVLRTVDTHRPEGQSVLKSALRRPDAVRRGSPPPAVTPPTRLLPHPVPLGTALRVGAPLRLDERVYAIERIAFEERLEGVEWWSNATASRDYFRIWLRGTEGVIEALAYLEKRSGARFLQAIVD
jgi:protein ImuB